MRRGPAFSTQPAQGLPLTPSPRPWQPQRKQASLASIDEELTQLRSRVAELEKLRLELNRQATGAIS